MRVTLSTTITMPPEEVWRRILTPDLLLQVAAPMVRFRFPDGRVPDRWIEGQRYLVSLAILGVLPFGKQWIVPTIHVDPETAWTKKLRDNGHSALIRRWDHWITVVPDADGNTRYTDDVEVDAGILTPFIWLFAQAFYRHRQRRWRALARDAAGTAR
jgi:ligand-binding SRPBCC domain-containing protein